MAVQTQAQKIKAILVSRHELLEAQKLALSKINIEIIEQIAQIPNEPQELQKWASEKKAQGITAIVTVALPPHLLVQLQRFFNIFIFKMKQIALVQNEEEAKKLVAEKPSHRTFLLGRQGEPIRVIEFEALVKTQIEIKEEVVATA